MSRVWHSLSLAALGGPAAGPAVRPPPPAAGPGAVASFLRDRRAGGPRGLGRLLSLKGAGGSGPGAAMGVLAAAAVSGGPCVKLANPCFFRSEMGKPRPT